MDTLGIQLPHLVFQQQLLALLDKLGLEPNAFQLPQHVQQVKHGLELNVSH